MAHYAKVLKEKPYVYAITTCSRCEAAHDGRQRERQNESGSAEDLGIKPVIVVERARNIDMVLAGIEAVRNSLGAFWFDEIKCARGSAPWKL